MPYFTARCIFKERAPGSAGQYAYEERMTLWQKSHCNDAIAAAEAEAKRYAADQTEASGRQVTYTGFVQTYEMDPDAVLADGAELFSLIRVSDLKQNTYLDKHFDTGAENQRKL